MNKCPAQGCGRGFESALVMEEHLRRRHPKYNAEALGVSQTQAELVEQEINKLPKIRTLKMKSREKKGPEGYLKSSSKGKNEPMGALNTSLVTAVISESRQYIDASENSLKPGKRMSISKRSSGNAVDIKKEKLPQIKSGRPLKLNALGVQKDSSYEQKDIMYTTAPNFKKIERSELMKQKSRSKQKYPSSSSQISLDEGNTHQNETDKLILAKTQLGFHEKDSRLHRPIKNIINRTFDKQKLAQSIVEEHKEKEEVQTGASPKKNTGESNRPVVRRNADLKSKPLRREGSLRKGQSKQELQEMYNFQERIIVFKPNVGPRLTIPSSAKVQFLFANSCGLTSLNLSNIEWLREISLQHNHLKDLTFLNFPNNYNVEKVYLDHNEITALDYLPPNLKVLSLNFNFIEGLQCVAKDLSRLAHLQELDFTFNPIRKQSNYKLHMMSSCVNLKKIDGLKVTKFDIELAGEYARMLDEELGLIPSQRYGNLMVSKCSNSPSTVISSTDQQAQEPGQSRSELQLQIGKLTKLMRQTTDHLKIIKQQNSIISAQTKELLAKQEEESFDSGALYEKLKVECAALELLNFLQYCSEEELQELIEKKQGG